jgi:hypothetical protein
MLTTRILRVLIPLALMALAPSVPMSAALAVAQPTESHRAIDRWWVAAGLGGLRPPFDEHLVSGGAEVGLARRHFAAIWTRYTGLQSSYGDFGSRHRSSWAIMAGPAHSARHFNAHAVAGLGRLDSCETENRNNPCQHVKRTAAAVDVGFDINVLDALGFRVRQSAWFGGGNGSWRPLTFGVIIGRLATYPEWDPRP